MKYQQDGGNDRLRAFLAESLDLWGVEGTVEAADAPLVAEIRASDGTTISIERITEATMPFRWLVRRRAAGDTREERPRPYGSLVGVLNALRAALGVDRGSPVRIAAAPDDAAVHPSTSRCAERPGVRPSTGSGRTGDAVEASGRTESS